MLNSGEQDYIDKIRLEQAARNKEDVPTRVRFRWEADQYGVMRPKGFHVSARGGQDNVPVRMLQKNSTTGNYEFWEDGADRPTIVWTSDDPGYVSPSIRVTRIMSTLRSRWKDSKGRIFEWDSQHGTVEMYDRSGRNHLGEFDPVSGEQTKPADPTRRVEK